jgi:Mycothiol maleylpyruvate isomerase N-terminal domain
MTFSAGHAASPRQDFRDAASAFLALVCQVPDDVWDRPALGVWTVRELVGHTARALSTVEDYLTHPAGAAPTTVSLGAAADTEGASLIDAVTYFRLGTQAGLSNSDAVAERGRAAGRALGDRPVRAVEETLERVLRLVDATADDVALTSRLAAMRLVDYLPTRTFELVVHGLDLQTALGLPPSAPRGPLASTLGKRPSWHSIRGSVLD